MSTYARRGSCCGRGSPSGRGGPSVDGRAVGSGRTPGLVLEAFGEAPAHEDVVRWPVAGREDQHRLRRRHPGTVAADGAVAESDVATGAVELDLLAVADVRSDDVLATTEMSTRFSIVFYRRLADGLRPADACHHAVRHLRDDWFNRAGEELPAFYWAQYTHFGSPW